MLVSGGKKEGLLVSGERKEGLLVSGVRKEGLLASGGRKEGLLVSGGREEGLLVSGGRKEELLVSGVRNKRLFPVNNKSQMLYSFVKTPQWELLTDENLDENDKLSKESDGNDGLSHPFDASHPPINIIGRFFIPFRLVIPDIKI